MRPVSWNILVLSCALLAAAQAAKKCPPPRRVPHTRLMGKNTGRQKYNIGDKVFFHCAEGFTPSGSPTVQCQHNGAWTKLHLKCEKKSCGNAGELRNGYFDYKGISLGDKVFAKCNEGYILKGKNFLTCKKSGWAGAVPACVEREATCSPPVVANSVSSGGAVSSYRVGDGVTFICSQGFQLDGAQQITCGPGGQWQPQPPRCLPSPGRPNLSLGRAAQLPEKSIRLPDKQTGGCGVPETTATSHANLDDQYITRTSFASGERVHYVCDVGYTHAGGSRYRTCNDGTWTPLHFRCEPRSCGSAGEIANGQFEYTGVEFGDTAEAVCDEGYRLVGRATRTCMSEGWDGRVPTCEPAACEAPPEVPNAEMRGQQEPPYTYRSAVVYQCHVGTLQGAKEIWCTKDGTWSAPPPTCKEIMCQPPRVYGTYWAGAQKSLYQYRDTITIECYPGLQRSGPRVVTCDSDGRWSPGLPKCWSARQLHRSSPWGK